MLKSICYRSVETIPTPLHGTMDTSHISHRELLERILPRESLRPDLRELIESALRDLSTETHEAASRRVVRALVADGVFREVAGTGDGPYTYLNRATGGRLVIDWTRPPSANPPDIRVPIPPDTTALRVPLATVDAILRLDAPPEHEDAHDGTNATVVRRALDILTTLLPGDFVAYVPADAEAAGAIDASSREVRYIPEWTDTRTFRPPAPGFRSVAFAPVHAGATRIGHLEVWGACRDS